MRDNYTSCYTHGTMRSTAKYLSASAFAVILAAMLMATSGGPVQAQVQAPPAQGPTFRVDVDLVTTDVIVRDSKSDQFIADLKAGDFEVYEDGVKQDLSSMVLVHGGRAFNVQAPPP